MFELLFLVVLIIGVVLLNENRSRLKKIEGQVFILRQRLGLTESEQAEPERAEDPLEEAGITPDPGQQSVVFQEAEPAPIDDSVEASASPEAIFEPADLAAPSPSPSLESRLGGQWTVWVGGIALAFGGLFFVSYAIEQGLLSPAIRVIMAGLFGLGLMVLGEIVRRRTKAEVLGRFKNAMIPGVLTAAGSLSVFATIYVAYDFYGFIGPATAFVALGVVSLATISLSLLYGQALSSLGLLASFVTPALVSTDTPNPWALFGFLSILWLANQLASRLRTWRISPSIANLGMAGWGVLYVMSFKPFEILPVTFAMMVMLAGTAFIWPGRDKTVPLMEGDKPATLEGFKRALSPRYRPITITLAIAVSLVTLGMVSPDSFSATPIQWAFVALVAGLAALGALRLHAIYPAIFSALLAIVGFYVLSLPWIFTSLADAVSHFMPPGAARLTLIGLAAVFVGLGTWVLSRKLRQAPEFSTLWALIMTATPLVLAAISFVYHGNYTLDWAHGGFLIALGAVYLALSEAVSKRLADDANPLPRDILLAGSYVAWLGALIVLTRDVYTIIGATILGFAYLLALRVRPWPLLPWFMVASGIFVAGQIALEPTIVGVTHLGTMPVFNVLLVGYGFPALVLAISAWLMRISLSLRLTQALQALASLFVLMTLAILVRHAIHDGVLGDALPTLAEQSIYTLLAIGASATLMTLDSKGPSVVFRWGGMLLGALSILFVLSAHLVVLNPYFSDELTGKNPLFNLLLIGYLLPGLAYALVAKYARSKRPLAYVMALALSGAVLAFAYVTLTVRRFWHGEGIADWKGFLQPETYTYSVIWLLLGVALLALGYRFRAISIRIAAASLVMIAVFKVFLIDMSNLEGLLRALSFIGLGAALIGIGMFYQRILATLEKSTRSQA